MSSKTVSGMGITSKTFPRDDGGWVRPYGWLALPPVSPTEEKMVGLYAIHKDANVIALSCVGAYTVNWGDGVTENFATGVTASHQYSYSDTDLAGTEYTDVAGLTYKQAIVVVTPQGGSSLTSLNLCKRHTSSSMEYSTGWLDITISAPSLSSLTVRNGYVAVRHDLLERFAFISSNSIADYYMLFARCMNLRYVEFFDTSSGTVFSSMFSDCLALDYAPPLDTSSCTNFSYMFDNCYRVTSIPLYDTSAGVNFSGMFAFCTSLDTIPLLNTAAGTNFNNMFYGCYAIKSIPQLNTALGTTFDSMFTWCLALTTIPLLNTAAGTNFNNMFNNCPALIRIPSLNFNSGTVLSGVFDSCPSLVSSAVTNTKASISYAGCKLSAAELNAIYTALATVTSKVIDVTGAYGTDSDTPSIATAKGWTVTG